MIFCAKSVYFIFSPRYLFSEMIKFMTSKTVVHVHGSKLVVSKNNFSDFKKFEYYSILDMKNR